MCSSEYTISCTLVHLNVVLMMRWWYCWYVLIQVSGLHCTLRQWINILIVICTPGGLGAVIAPLLCCCFVSDEWSCYHKFLFHNNNLQVKLYALLTFISILYTMYMKMFGTLNLVYFMCIIYSTVSFIVCIRTWSSFSKPSSFLWQQYTERNTQDCSSNNCHWIAVEHNNYVVVNS